MMMLSGLLAVEVESLTKSAVVADRSAKVAVFIQGWEVGEHMFLVSGFVLLCAHHPNCNLTFYKTFEVRSPGVVLVVLLR